MRPVVSDAVVGAAGFEPATSCSQSRRATGLRYAPSMRAAVSRRALRPRDEASAMVDGPASARSVRAVPQWRTAVEEARTQ